MVKKYLSWLAACRECSKFGLCWCGCSKASIGGVAGPRRYYCQFGYGFSLNKAAFIQHLKIECYSPVAITVIYADFDEWKCNMCTDGLWERVLRCIVGHEEVQEQMTNVRLCPASVVRNGLWQMVTLNSHVGFSLICLWIVDRDVLIEFWCGVTLGAIWS